MHPYRLEEIVEFILKYTRLTLLTFCWISTILAIGALLANFFTNAETTGFMLASFGASFIFVLCVGFVEGLIDGDLSGVNKLLMTAAGLFVTGALLWGLKIGRMCLSNSLTM